MALATRSRDDAEVILPVDLVNAYASAHPPTCSEAVRLAWIQLATVFALHNTGSLAN